MEQITFERLPAAFTHLFRRIENIERLLQHTNGQQPETDQLINVQQAAEFLSLSVATVYTLVSKSELPVNKRGKRLYFSKLELTGWIKAGRKKTQAEIHSEAEQYLQSKKKRG